MTRRRCSDEDAERIEELIQAHQDEEYETLGRHLTEMKEMRLRHERELRKIPGYPAWAGWRAIHK